MATVLAVAPILYTEAACRSPIPGLESGPYASAMTGEEGKRPEVRTWLTYPEWYIVYSADSYGRYLASGRPPSGFSYSREILGFWSGLCAVNRAGLASPEGAGDAKTMLYTIGVSFSAEMAVKGLYENVIGRFAEWIGGWDSPSDAYAADVWQRYGAFMHETPWHKFPFSETFGGLWRTKQGDSAFRHWERRLALSLEYGVKARYAGLIGWASGATLGADETELRFVARGDAKAIAAIDERLRPVATSADGLVTIEAPRYAQFTDLLLKMAAAKVELVEIAGNDDIFVTLLLPPDAAPPGGGVVMLDDALGDRPGRRIGLSVKVAKLLPMLRAVRAGGGTVEHVYDY